MVNDWDCEGDTNNTLVILYDHFVQMYTAGLHNSNRY